MIIAYGRNRLFIKFCPTGLPEDTLYRRLDDAFRRLKKGEDVGEMVCEEAVVKRYCAERYPTVRAAGGVVCDREGRLLLMERRGMWDLPKGKIEEGESPEEAALREVKEETGLQTPKIDASLCETYHIHNRYGRWETKETHWYLMTVENEEERLVPQEEEDISQCMWIEEDEWERRLSRSFATMWQVVEKLNEVKHKETRVQESI